MPAWPACQGGLFFSADPPHLAFAALREILKVFAGILTEGLLPLSLVDKAWPHATRRLPKIARWPTACLTVLRPAKTPPLLNSWTFKHPAQSEPLCENIWVIRSSFPHGNNCTILPHAPFKYFAIRTTFSMSLTCGAATERDASFATSCQSGRALPRKLQCATMALNFVASSLLTLSRMSGSSPSSRFAATPLGPHRTKLPTTGVSRVVRQPELGCPRHSSVGVRGFTFVLPGFS